MAAKACGIYVEDFSLGMGPKLLRIQGKETSYTLRLLPIGGSCSMAGEDEDSDNPRAFCNKKIWQRIVVIAAGPIMNFLFAIVLFIIVFMGAGTYSTENVAGAISPGSPAAAAGLQEGDRILSINGQQVRSWEDISLAINASPGGEALTVVLERKGAEQQLLITPLYNAEHGLWYIGILPVAIEQTLVGAIRLGFEQSVLFMQALVSAIADMISGTTKVELTGPVGIVSIISTTARQGMMQLLFLTAFLSMNLGLINLLPLPALDGSRIVFLLVEGVRGRPFNPEKEGMVHLVGLFLLFGLMIFVTYHDIVRLISGVG